jgi:hypothetical protein
METENKMVAVRNETAADVLAATAKATIEARYIVAIRKPRDIDVVRQELLKECKRPGFAETAQFRKKVSDNKEVTGLSIRFAESALQALTNVMVKSVVVYEDDKKIVINVSITDIEKNFSYDYDCNINKTVERKYPKKGDVILSERLNSYNEKIFLVPTNEESLLVKQNSAISKAIRTEGLRLLPKYIQDECSVEIEKTKIAQIKENPDREKNKVFDLFNAIGVSIVDIKKHLGYDTDKIQPKDLIDLKNIYQAIKDGETTWKEWIEPDDKNDSNKKPETKAPQAISETQKPEIKPEVEPIPTHTDTVYPYLQEIERLLKLKNPTGDKEVSKQLLEKSFETDKWSWVKKLPVEKLKAGISKLTEIATQKLEKSTSEPASQIDPETQAYMDALNAPEDDNANL